MCVLHPIKVVITEGFDAAAAAEKDVPDFPQIEGSSCHKLSLTPTFFMDTSDFREVDEADYFGLAPGKWVGLKYGGCILCREIVRDAAGAIMEIRVTYATLPPEGTPGVSKSGRPNGNVHWVPENAVALEARIYGHLFTVPFVTANWEQELNHGSEVIVKTALVDPSVLSPEGGLPAPETHFQFERVGIFVVDRDSAAQGRLIVNRTAPLKVSVLLLFFAMLR